MSHSQVCPDCFVNVSVRPHRDGCVHEGVVAFVKVQADLLVAKPKHTATISSNEWGEGGDSRVVFEAACCAILHDPKDAGIVMNEADDAAKLGLVLLYAFDDVRQQLQQQAWDSEATVTLLTNTVNIQGEELEALRQQLAQAQQERDEWKLSFETSNKHVGELESRLREADAALAQMREKASPPPSSP